MNELSSNIKDKKEPIQLDISEKLLSHINQLILSTLDNEKNSESIVFSKLDGKKVSIDIKTAMLSKKVTGSIYLNMDTKKNEIEKLINRFLTDCSITFIEEVEEPRCIFLSLSDQLFGK